MRRKKTLRAALLLVLCLLLSGCRVRTGMDSPAPPDDPRERAADSPGVPAGSLPEGSAERDAAEKDAESGDRTRENPEASRKEYDENRPAEILPGTERTVHGSGEGDGFAGAGEGAEHTAAKLNPGAGQTATQTVPAEEADRKGTSENAEEADSAASYYSVLLQERTGSLFECQRLTVYWETAEDHLTVFKTSAEHRLILQAGANDASARLPESNLRVDDGWIGRKNPGVIVKAVKNGILGASVYSADAARGVYAALLSREGWPALDAVHNRRVLLLSEDLLGTPELRLAAALIIAKTASPDLFADVKTDEALAMLAEEATGQVPGGIFYYTEGGL